MAKAKEIRSKRIPLPLAIFFLLITSLSNKLFATDLDYRSTYGDHLIGNKHHQSEISRDVMIGEILEKKTELNSQYDQIIDDLRTIKIEIKQIKQQVHAVHQEISNGELEGSIDNEALKVIQLEKSRLLKISSELEAGKESLFKKIVELKAKMKKLDQKLRRIKAGNKLAKKV